jgi:rubrerythrin
VLTACRDMEASMAELYETLAKVHTDVPYMAKVWNKTANEERNHAAQFTLALDIGSDAVESVRVDLSVIERTQRAVELLRKECVTHPPTVEQALRATIAFEEALINLHADKIPIFAQDAHKKLFSAMLGADREHVNRLRRTLEQGPSTPTPTPVPLTLQRRRSK